MSLKLINVDHSYGTRLALTGVNLTIHPGDCYGFIGHNGAGKTTAMRIALGLIHPSQGRVIVDGFNATEDPLEARVRMGGLIERPGFFDYWDGPKNLKLLAKLQGIESDNLKQDIEELMALVGLGHVPDLPVRAYSQGMRQRLGIAQALLGRPRYLLLDEPGNGLDPEGLAEMRVLLKRLTQEEGMTVLLSSHQLHEVSEICNRIAVLKKGHVLLEDDAQLILNDGSSVFDFKTQDDTKAKELIESEGLTIKSSSPGVLSVDLEDKAPADITRVLVEGGVALDSFTRQAPSLEEIYLRLEQPRNAKDASDQGIEEEGEKLAPKNQLWRVMRYEWQRLMSRPIFFVAMLLPLIVSFWDIRSRYAEAEDARSKVEAGDLATTTDATAFDGVLWGLRNSLLLSALILCALASQSLAGELDRGTLRNALLRPVRRSMLTMGKMLTFVISTVVAYGGLMGLTCLFSSFFFDFTAQYELLPNGELMEMVPAEDLQAALNVALLSGLLPMLTYTLWGFVSGAVTKTPTAALITSIGGVFAFEFLRPLVPTSDDEVWLPSTHMPSKLGDKSFLAQFEDGLQGLANAQETMSQMPLLPWCAMAVLVSLFVMSRRNVR